MRLGGGHFGIASEVEASDPDVLWRVLTMMDGTRSPRAIVDAVLAENPMLPRREVQDLLDALIEAGFVEEGGVAPPDALSERALERYSRGINFYSWVDSVPRSSPWDVQLRLKASSATVLGLGGAGSAAAVALAGSGVGSLLCVDFDTVELSNLNRQFTYTESDVGRSKVDCLTTRLRAINSEIDVTGLEVEIGSEDEVAELLSGTDILLVCADRPDPTTLLDWTNRAALALGRPWVMSFYEGPTLAVALQDPPSTPCYQCLRLATRPLEEERVRLFRSRPVQAAIGPSAALAGNYAALEAIYHLGGLEPRTRGRIFHQSLTSYDFSYFVEGEPTATCPACHGAAGANSFATRAP